MPYVMAFGGGRYTSVAWFKTEEEAKRECDRMNRTGSWSGVPRKVDCSDLKEKKRGD